MNKKDIIQVISGAEAQIDKSIFKDDDKKGIGCNQFRELADICSSAECYEEVELLVRYNEAKDCPDNNQPPKSWNHPMKDGRTTFADIVISCMEKIKAQSDENSCLKNLSLFFGYFYWNSRIWAAENGMKGNGESYKNYNNKNYNNKNYNKKKRGT